VNSAYYILRDSHDRIVQSAYHGLDTKGHSEGLYKSFGKQFDVQNRFNKIFHIKSSHVDLTQNQNLRIGTGLKI